MNESGSIIVCMAISATVLLGAYKVIQLCVKWLDDVLED